MVHVADGLEMDVDRGPNWLFVKLQPGKKPDEEVPQMVDQLWSVVSRHFIYRLVLELEEFDSMPTGLVGQLATLQQRLAQRGGSLRICGLSSDCVETLHDCQLDSALPNHATREEAVLG